jgi:hypothetical protein
MGRCQIFCLRQQHGCDMDRLHCSMAQSSLQAMAADSLSERGAEHLTVSSARRSSSSCVCCSLLAFAEAGPGLYFLENLVRLCPPGTYQPEYHLQGPEACKPCANGVTTSGSAAVAAAECAFAQPGYGLTTCSSSSGCQAQICGVGQYNVGGLQGSNSCQACPWGLTTQGPGATDVSACCECLCH